MKPTTIITTAILAITSLILQAETPTVSISAVSKTQTPSTISKTYKHHDQALEINIESTPIITEKDIQTIEKGATSPKAVRIILSSEGAAKLNSRVKDMLGQQIAIVINDRVVMVPTLNTVSLGTKIELDDILTEEEAKLLVEFYENKKG